MRLELYHEGVKRKSGRYPYGSGDRPYQHDGLRRSVSKIVKNNPIEKAKNKWKERKEQRKKERLNRKNAEYAAEHYKTLLQKTRELSVDELDAEISRLKKEKEYMELFREVNTNKKKKEADAAKKDKDKKDRRQQFLTQVVVPLGKEFMKYYNEGQKEESRQAEANARAAEANAKASENKEPTSGSESTTNNTTNNYYVHVMNTPANEIPIEPEAEEFVEQAIVPYRQEPFGLLEDKTK